MGDALRGLVKSGPVVSVRDLARALAIKEALSGWQKERRRRRRTHDGAPIVKYSRNFSPAELDAIEQLLVRMDVTLKARLRDHLAKLRPHELGAVQFCRWRDLMERRSFNREWKLEAVKRVRKRDVALAPAVHDLDLHVTCFAMREQSADPQ